MRSLLTRLIPLSALALTLIGCSAARSIVGEEAKLSTLQAADNRTCPDLRDAPAQARPSEGVYDGKPLIVYIDGIRRQYDDCAALQKRNLTQLRGDRRRAKP